MSSLDYNDLMQTASQKTDDRQEVGDTWNEISKSWVNIVHECMAKAEAKGLKEYYIWILISKDPNVVNSMKIWPFVRTTRPSPYQAFDHFLYKVNSKGVSFQWGVPSLATSSYVLAHPDKFPKDYVKTLRKWLAGTLV